MNKKAQPLMPSSPPRHGGDIQQAIAEYGGEPEQWLDLSTGISPWAYPIIDIAPTDWQQLPPTTDNLITVAATYYRCNPKQIIATPGSQMSIRLLPSLLQGCQSVAIPAIGYKEHAYTWQSFGHKTFFYNNLEQLEGLIAKQQVDNAVVINPNNPSCELIDPVTLITLSTQLKGFMLVDEAFADLDPSFSLAATSQLNNIVVLRSIGKFFGLAGARIGFVISAHKIIKQLDHLFGPWSLNGPAQLIAEHALADNHWQQQQRARVRQQANYMSTLLSNLIKDTTLSLKTHGLFCTIAGGERLLTQLHKELAQQKIWTRLGDPFNNEQIWLRCALPGNNFERLASSLNTPEILNHFKK